MCRGGGLAAVPSFLPFLSAAWAWGLFTLLTERAGTGKLRADGRNAPSRLVTVGKGRLRPKRDGAGMPQDLSPGKTMVQITSRLALGSPLLAACRAAPGLLQTEPGGSPSSG